jgi:hypothetical protein
MALGKNVCSLNGKARENAKVHQDEGYPIETRLTK